VKVSSAVKATLQRILKQQTEAELSAKEAELAEHIETRNRLRQQLEADAAADAAEQSRHDAALAALEDFGKRHSWEERNSVRAVIQEGQRLSAEANRKPEFTRYLTGESPREGLIRGCRDLSIQGELGLASLGLEFAVRELAAEEQKIAAAALRAADARKDRLELLGSIQRQFGREGGRWRRVESGDEVSIEGLQDAAGEPAIHPENLAFLNRQLAPLNRRIREYLQQLEGSEVQRLRAAVAKAEGALAVVEAKAIESEV
jgi:hypothetical protein